MKKIYLLMQHYEANFDYTYDVPAACPCFAYESEKTAKRCKKMFEEMNNADKDGFWDEDDFRCYYCIEEINLVEG